MTQDPQIILKGLECCSHINCLCEECPFCQAEVHCRELELDAAELIRSLQSTVETQEGTIDKLGQDIDIKVDYIHKLEERLGIEHE